MTVRMGLVLLFTVVGLTVVADTDSPAYILTDLGPIRAAYSQANAINSSGTVVGYQNITSSGPSHAFVFQQQLFVDISPLFPQMSVATALNDSNIVIGDWATNFGENRNFAYWNGFVWDLGFIGARRLSNFGQLLASLDGVNSTIYNQDGSKTQLSGFLGNAINDFGHVAGVADGGHATLIFDNQRIDLTSYGLPQTLNSVAKTINNSDEVAGYVGANSCSGNSGAGFLSRHQRVFPIPHAVTSSRGIQPKSMNNFGVVVGEAERDNCDRYAFIFDGTRTKDLNSIIVPGSGLEMVDATGINDSAQIAGIARTAGGEMHAVLLSRSQPPPTCGVDASKSISITQRQFELPLSPIVLELVVLRNASSSAVLGPVSYVIGGIENGTFVGSGSVTTCFSPLGESFVVTHGGGDDVLLPGETDVFGLWLINQTLGLTHDTIDYIPRVRIGIPQ